MARVPVVGCVNVKAHVWAFVSATLWRLPLFGLMLFVVVQVPLSYSATVNNEAPSATFPFASSPTYSFPCPLCDVISGVDPPSTVFTAWFVLRPLTSPPT
jgi:hypothetical protein